MLEIIVILMSNSGIIVKDLKKYYGKIKAVDGISFEVEEGIIFGMLGLKEAGKTVFLTTHYMDEAEKLCDKLVVIDHGIVIAKGSPKSLIRDNFNETAIEFTDSGFSDAEREELFILRMK